MTVKRSSSLHDDLDGFVRSEVASGRSLSASAVVHEGLLELRARREREAREKAEEDAFLDMLRERAKGPFLSREEADRRFEDLMARKRNEFGLDD